VKDDPFNPGAKAIIHYREVTKDDTKALEFEHYRIEILTDDGRSYGDVEIPYAEKLTSVENIRARDVQPDGKTVDFSGQIFDKLVVKAKHPEMYTIAGTESMPTTHWVIPNVLSIRRSRFTLLPLP
jgi:hypothetical protein